jgi:cystathionine gamma-synthase
MSPKRDRKGSTRAAQALGWVDTARHGVSPPIYPSTAYERDESGAYPGGHSYSRDQNPTFDQAEALLASLEGGASARLFSSGMAAATTVFEVIEPGSHVVAPSDMYFTLQRWLANRAARGLLDVDFVPSGDLDALRAALRPGATRVVWLESPTNPTCGITDLAAAAACAHEAGALVVADGTLATPVLTRPLELGADLVMHSATKQLNGHADVLAGALVTAREDAVWERIGHERGNRGAVLGAFDAWLLLRGMRTLYLRVAASCLGAQHVAEALQAHPQVTQVMYPGLPEHPGHAVAAAQMQGGFGALLSFRVAGGEPAARKVLSGLELFRDATSLGGVESLVEHRARIEGPDSQLPRDLLRLSIGIEDREDLATDLRHALDRLGGPGGD